MKRIEDALNDCIERMAQGETLASCLASYPDLTEELKPLLEMSRAVTETSLSIKPRPEFKAAARYKFHQAMTEKSSKVERARSAFRGRRLRWATVAVTALLIFVVGSGMGIASANSMPGDALYGIKTLAEQVRMGLTFGSENKAQLHLELAEERSEEMQVLVDSGNLEAVNDIGIRLTNHLEQAKTVAPRLLENEEIVTRLETLANKQAALLEGIYDNVPTGAQEIIDDLIESVNAAYEAAIVDILGTLPDIQMEVSGAIERAENRLIGTIEVTNNTGVAAEITQVNYALYYATGRIWEKARIVKHNRNTLGGLEVGTVIEAYQTEVFAYIVHYAVPGSTETMQGIISIKLDGRNLAYNKRVEVSIPALSPSDPLTSTR